MAEQPSDSQRAKVEAICAEAGTDVARLAAEARRWRAIAGRLGLSLESAMDLVSRLDGRPRDPTSADWRDVEKVAAEASLDELRYAQQQAWAKEATPPGGKAGDAP